MKKKIPFICALAAALILAVSGCSRAKQEASYDGYTAAETKAASAMPDAFSGGYYEAYEEAAHDMYNESEDLRTTDLLPASGGEILVSAPGRKLIKTVYMNLEATEMDAAVSGISSRISELEGYIENSCINNPSDSTGYGQRKSADIVARIPSDRLDEFISSIEGSVNVTYKSENVEDVTLKYTDIESHKHSLEVERKRLEELIAEAEDVDSIIALETRLSEIRYQIESYGSQLRTYDNQVDYATVTMYITEVLQYTPAPSHTLGERIRTAFRESLDGLKEFGEAALVWIIAALPVFIILGIISLILFLVIRCAVRKSKTRKEARDAEALAQQAARLQAAAEAQAKVMAQRIEEASACCDSASKPKTDMKQEAPKNFDHGGRMPQ